MATLSVKPGVQPRLVHLCCAIANVAARLEAPSQVVITSAMDSTHGTDSLHYALRAVDVRTKNFPTLAAKHSFVIALKGELGDGYDVVLEQLGSPNEHIHCEFDPR